jgi:uncharacterized NAD(P)/FAD-binding protein YdhS
MVAANLARRGINSIIIEANGRAGQGTAFSTGEPAHLLNIRADSMSAWPDEPDDFALQTGTKPSAYAERRLFGRYLRSILDEAIDSGQVEVIEDRAVGADHHGERWRVRLESGSDIEAETLVLALGNQPPARLAQLADVGDRVIDDPWGNRAREAIGDAAARQSDVLILGTSLTMVDVALSLRSAGHEGRIVALSRRGKIPLGQELERAPAFEPDKLPQPKVRSIARWLRRHSAKVGWRAAVDSLRPHSHGLWQSLPIEEKSRFLRFGRPWWDIHRHRIAPQISKQMRELIEQGRLEVLAGRLEEVHSTDEGVEVTIRRRGQDSAGPPQRFAYIFNCTGPLGDVRRTEDPLLRQLLDDASVEPDELAIGLSVDERSRAGERVWALGTLTKGRYWEIIAVPDIRVQAAAVADDIATELGQ